MKFNRVSDDKLQIIISKDDLEQRDISKMDFLPHNPRAQKVFYEILEEAREACGFEVGQNAQLMIEAFPMTGDSMLITVTKLSHKGGLPFDMESLGRELLGSLGLEEELLEQEEGEEEEISPAETGDCIYRFATMDDAIHAAATVWPQYEKETMLLRYGDCYFLAFLQKDWLTQEDQALLSEYGDITNVILAFYQEHGEVIIAEHAIEILAALA